MCKCDLPNKYTSYGYTYCKCGQEIASHIIPHETALYYLYTSDLMNPVSAWHWRAQATICSEYDSVQTASMHNDNCVSEQSESVALKQSRLTWMLYMYYFSPIRTGQQCL